MEIWDLYTENRELTGKEHIRGKEIPAKRLYEKCGFQYMGDVDLERNIAGIPLFFMYELNL